MYQYILISLFLFSLVLQKGFLKFEYKSDQEAEKTHILVKCIPVGVYTIKICSYIIMTEYITEQFVF